MTQCFIFHDEAVILYFKWFLKPDFNKHHSSALIKRLKQTGWDFTKTWNCSHELFQKLIFASQT